MTIPQPPCGRFDFETAGPAGFVWDAPSQKWRPPKGARLKGLPTVGANVYTEHPEARVLSLSYKLPAAWWDGHAWRMGGRVVRWRPGLPNPQELFDFLAAGGLLEAHNVMFERLVWANICMRLYGWPDLEPFARQLRCSMATARVNAYPGGLGPLSAVLKLAAPKDKDGKRLLDKFSIPRNPTKADPRLWIMPEDDPEDAERLYAYNDRDVEAEEEAASRMPPMSLAELQFWLIDQEINRAGIHIDRAGVRDCIAVLEQALAQYGDECRAITGFDPTQLKELTGWLAARGVYTDSLDANAVTDLLARLPPPPPQGDPRRRVLEIRQLIGSASVKKLYAMEHQATRDDRLCDLIVHHGARTGRPTGEGPQPLNLPKAGPKLVWCGSLPDGTWGNDCRRPFKPGHAVCPWCFADAAGLKPKEWKAEAVDIVLDVMSHRSLEVVEYYFGDALGCISGCIRGLFDAAPGHDLIASDYSAIEAVITAMLSGEQWRIDAFRRGDPIYLLSASKITGTPLQTYLDYFEANGQHHPDRQKIGKVNELACLGPQTQVLTKRGYLPITLVSTGDMVWDGEAWVEHLGVVKRGHREVINLAGTLMTPDHLIICGSFWREAKQLASCPSFLYRALASGSENLWFATPKKRPPFSSYALARDQCLTPLLGRIYEKARRPGALSALGKPEAESASYTINTQQYCQMTNTGKGFLIGFPQYSPELIPASPPILGTKITPVEEFRCTSLGEKAEPHFCSTSLLWRDGTIQSWIWTASKLTATTSLEIYVSPHEQRTRQTEGLSQSCKNAATIWSDVYDIAHAGPRNRFTIRTDAGPLIVHNCGFGGWIGASRAMGSTETDAVIKAQILTWRDASPCVVEMWGGQTRGTPWDGTPERYGFEGAAVDAILHPGQVFTAFGIDFYMRDGALIIRLLSGRELTYQNAHVTKSTREYASPWELTIVYWTWNSNPKYGPMGWCPMTTYGPKLAENIIQAVAHDILRHAIINLRAAGYWTRLHVYDEICAQVRQGFGSIEEFERIMSIMPPWAQGWPIIATGGWRGRRYRKG